MRETSNRTGQGSRTSHRDGAQQVERFNEKVAEVVSDTTGNMWFFWASLAFILILRLSHPPSINEFLLDIENDLQLLLLAANAVVTAKQTRALMHILDHIRREADHIEKSEKERLAGETPSPRAPTESD